MYIGSCLAAGIPRHTRTLYCLKLQESGPENSRAPPQLWMAIMLQMNLSATQRQVDLPSSTPVPAQSHLVCVEKDYNVTLSQRFYEYGPGIPFSLRAQSLALGSAQMLGSFLGAHRRACVRGHWGPSCAV